MPGLAPESQLVQAIFFLCSQIPQRAHDLQFAARSHLDPSGCDTCNLLVSSGVSFAHENHIYPYPQYPQLHSRSLERFGLAKSNSGLIRLPVWQTERSQDRSSELFWIVPMARCNKGKQGKHSAHDSISASSVKSGILRGTVMIDQTTVWRHPPSNLLLSLKSCRFLPKLRRNMLKAAAVATNICCQVDAWFLDILISSTSKHSFLNIQSNHCILSSRHIGTAQTSMRIIVILLLSGWISVLPVHVCQIWQLWSSESVIGETLIPAQINCIGRELQQPNLVLCCTRYQILRFACVAFACSQMATASHLQS